MNSPTKPPSDLRRQTLLKLAKMDPHKRARLLELEALRRGLKPKRTQVHTPAAPSERVTLSASETLTPSEIERLRQSAIDLNAYGRKAFPSKG